MQRLVTTLVVTLLLASAGACSGGDDPPQPSCEAELADGSCTGVRLSTICAETYCQTCSACQAKAGDCILVAAGAYGAATLAGGVNLLGSGAAVVTIKASSEKYALVVQGGQGGLLRGFTLSGDRRGLLVDGVGGLQIEQVRTDGVRELGIAAKKSVGLTLHEVTLSKARPDSAGKFGLGLLLVEASSATATRLAVQQSAAQGVHAATSALKLSDSAVSDSGRYGVVIDCAQDPARMGTLSSSVDRVLVQRSAGVGLWVGGAKLTVTQSEIGQTALSAGLARGVELQGQAQVELSGCRIHHSAGQGIVIDDSSGKLLKNTVSDNNERGIWLQCSKPASLALDGNEVTDSKLVGIGSTGCTGLSIKGGKVARIKKLPVLVGASSVVIGDGVQLLKQSEALGDGLTIEAAERVGLLVDGAKGTISNSTIDGAAPLVVQNAPPADVKTSNNKDAAGKALGATTPTPAYGVITDFVSLVGSLPLPIP